MNIQIYILVFPIFERTDNAFEKDKMKQKEEIKKWNDYHCIFFFFPYLCLEKDRVLSS